MAPPLVIDDKRRLLLLLLVVVIPNLALDIDSDDFPHGSAQDPLLLVNNKTNRAARPVVVELLDDTPIVKSVCYRLVVL